MTENEEDKALAEIANLREEAINRFKAYMVFFPKMDVIKERIIKKRAKDPLYSLSDEDSRGVETLVRQSFESDLGLRETERIITIGKASKSRRVVHAVTEAIEAYRIMVKTALDVESQPKKEEAFYFFNASVFIYFFTNFLKEIASSLPAGRSS